MTIPERRQFGRRQTYRHGTIHIKGRPGVPCLVRNVSQRGAFLEVEIPAYLPFQFELEVDPSVRRIPCEMRHTRPDGVGVNFVEANAPVAVVHTSTIDDVQQWCGRRRDKK